MKRYYIVGILVVICLALNEELKTPSSQLGSAARYYLDHPSWSEYLIGNAKPMGHIKDTVPENSNNMTLKEFMVSHVTAYWPGVFRELVQDMPGYKKWQEGAKYFKGRLAFDTVQVSTTKNAEVIPPFNQQQYIEPVEMTYQQFAERSARPNEDNLNLFLDNIQPPKDLAQDI